jgi:hypothetical protein
MGVLQIIRQMIKNAKLIVWQNKKKKVQLFQTNVS